MMTPQEVSERAFPKASFGGYNMAMVDEFLDQLTADYTALYKENATLKAKMKVLADSLEEYRATEKGMRRALLAAQQAADEMVREAESRKAELVRAAEAEAQARVNELRRKVADEEARLTQAQSATADYVDSMKDLCRKQAELLAELEQSSPAPVSVPVSAPDPVAQAVEAIEQSVQRMVEKEELPEEQPPVEEPTEEIPAVPVAASEERIGRSRRDQERAKAFVAGPGEEEPQGDTSPTRRIDFDNLQFGANYDLK